MKFRNLAIALSFVASLGGYSQNKISGVIIDDKTQNPLIGVTVLNTNSGKGSISNDMGEFSIILTEFPVSLSFRHLGYFEDSLQILDKEHYQEYYEGKKIILSLRINPFKLDEVVISTPGLATKLFSDEPYAIIDFVVKNDRFIGLGYKNHNPTKREIFLGKLSGKVIRSNPLRSFQEIYQDCLGEVYAVTNKSATHIRVENDSIIFVQAYDPAYFEDYVRPIQAFGDSSLFYLIESKNGLFRDYYIHNIDNQDARVFYRVGDYGMEQGYTNMDRNIKSLVEEKTKRAFIPRDGMRTIKHRISHQMFRRYNEYKPVDSRMFQLGDTVLLFDFDYRAVHCFTLGADLLWRTDIQIELDKDFTGRVHYDPISNRFFLEFTHSQLTYLIEIDPQTGEELQTIPINKFKHIDHISIYKNRAFFLHQPDFGDRGKKIYYLDI